MVAVLIMSNCHHNKDFDHGRGLHKKECDYSHNPYYE